MALSEDPTLSDPESAVRTLQTEWRKIGHVPKAQADALWQRFKSACDQALHPPSHGGGTEEPLRFQPFTGLQTDKVPDKTR